MGTLGGRADQSHTCEHVILSLSSREGGESHRTRPGLLEEPIYFCFLIFIALLLYLQLPCVPSRDLSWAIFLGMVEISW